MPGYPCVPLAHFVKYHKNAFYQVNDTVTYICIYIRINTYHVNYYLILSASASENYSQSEVPTDDDKDDKDDSSSSITFLGFRIGGANKPFKTGFFQSGLRLSSFASSHSTSQSLTSSSHNAFFFCSLSSSRRPHSSIPSSLLPFIHR